MARPYVVNDRQEIITFHRTIGLIIARWRRIRHLSREALASLIDVDSRSVRYWESGQRRITLLNAWKLAQALQIPLLTFTPVLRVKLATRTSRERQKRKKRFTYVNAYGRLRTIPKKTREKMKKAQSVSNTKTPKARSRP